MKITPVFMEDMENLLQFSLINIDKPQGPTSYSVSEFMKRRLQLKKTSHMGTLDPAVTGVLPITLGRACKLAGYFITHDKDYIGVMHTHNDQDIKELQKIIDKDFSGKIKQTPPRKSAVKREERVREIYNFKFLEATEDKRDFLFKCSVQGGTYIRKICSDLGDQIGGAHMSELRRTSAGIFDESTLVTLDEFEKAVESYNNGDEKDLRSMLMSAEDAIKRVLRVIEVDKSALKSLYTGKPLFRSNVRSDVNDVAEGDVFALFSGKTFVGIYKRTGEEIIFARSEFVYN